MTGTRAPVRTCIGCRSTRPSGDLVRLSIHDGRLSTDRTAGGRGAWICHDTACVEVAIKRRAAARAFRIPLPSGFADELRAALAEVTVFPPGAQS